MKFGGLDILGELRVGLGRAGVCKTRIRQAVRERW